MSCRNTTYGSAMTSFAMITSGLTERQTLSTYHALRRTSAARHSTVPDEVEWNTFLDNQITLVEESTLTPARRRSVIDRLERSRETIPDATSWYAVSHIRSSLTFRARRLRREVAQISMDAGITATEGWERFREYADEVPTGRGVDTPEGYSEWVSTNAARTLPSDPGTFAGLARLRNDAEQSRVWESNPRIITDFYEVEENGYRMIPGASPHDVVEAGYDDDTGRVEVRVNGVVRQAYYGATEDEYHSLFQRNGAVVLRGMSRYRTQEEMERRGHTVRCGACGQFVSEYAHPCPAGFSNPGDALEELMADAHPRADRVRSRNRTVADVLEGETQPEAAEAEDPASPDEWPAPKNLVDLPTLPVAGGRRFTSFNTADMDMIEDVVDMRLAIGTRYEDILEHGKTQPVLFEFYAETMDPHGWGEGAVSVNAEYYNPGGGEPQVFVRNAKCECFDYEVNGECDHVNATLEGMVRGFTRHEGADDRVNNLQAASTARNVERSISLDWSRQEAAMNAARQRWNNESDGFLYSENPEQFEADYQEARRAWQRGDNPMSYTLSGALGGEFTRESGRGFGIEIEYDIPEENIEDIEEINEQIATELFDLGLTASDVQEEYGAHGRRGFIDTHQRGWGFEEDCTVAGEIVSPVMYDEPETWDNIYKVCEVIRRNGGIVSMRTGSHVHVGTPLTTTESAVELINLSNQYEDVMYRMSSSPFADNHRPTEWCGPNRDTNPNGYRDLNAVVDGFRGHNYSVNMQSSIGDSGHTEIRHWDGTLNHKVIQAQIQMSTGLVLAAERNGGAGLPRVAREPLGTHALIDSRDLIEDSRTTMSFIDTICKTDSQRSNMAALYAGTNWADPRRMEELTEPDF